MMVSVILPFYNRPQYLNLAIESYLKQGYTNKELILVNDGGDEPDYLKEYLKKPGIRYYNKPLTNAPDTFNYGLDKAKGELITILNDDDLLSDDSISSRVKVFNDLAKYGVEVVYTDAVIIDEGGFVFSYREAPAVNAWREINHEKITFGTMMWKKTIHFKIGFLPSDLLMFCDTWFKIRCLMECCCIRLETPSMFYRVWGGQETKVHANKKNSERAIMFSRLREVYKI